MAGHGEVKVVIRIYHKLLSTGTSSIENIEELNKFPEPRNQEAK